MKKVFYFFLLLITVQSFGQSPVRKPGFTQFFSNNQYNKIWGDLVTNIARADTNVAVTGIGQTVQDSTTNKIYHVVSLTGKKWEEMGIGGGSGDSTFIKPFANVTALRGDNFYTKTGNLVAKLQGYNTPGDGGGTDFYWDGTSSATDDGVFVIKPTAVSGSGRWLKIFIGRVRAAEVGVKSDGTDQTSTLNSLFALSTVKEVIFDNGDVKITGKVDGQNKKVKIENGARIIGVGGSNADTLTNFSVNANPLVQIFDTSLAITNLDADKISVRWFGAKGSASSISQTPDDWPAFNRALVAGRASYDDGVLYGGIKKASIVYVPAADYGKYYYLSKPIRADNYGAIHLSGETGTMSDNSGSRIVVAIDSNFFRTDGQPDCKIENLSILSSGGTIDTAHGFDVNNHIELYNIIVNGFPGDGFHLEGSLPNNLNISKFSDLTAINCHGNGLYVNGADANAMKFYNINCTDNFLWGVYETSFLGNTYVACHTDNNGRIRPYVYTSAGTYWIYNDVAAGVKPGVTSGWQSYYERIGATDSSYAAWDTTKAYKSGGGYRSDDPNARTVFIGCYGESDQPPNYFKGPCMVVGGLLANNISTNSSGVILEPSTYDGSLRLYGALTSIRQTSPGADSSYGAKFDNDGLYLGANSSSFRPKIIYSKSQDKVTFAAGGRSGFNFVGSEGNATWNAGGRSSALLSGTPIFEGGAAFVVPELTSSRYNILGFRTTKPSAADPSNDDYFNSYVVGDLFLYSGTDTTLLGWRCVSGGNDTTSIWREIRTGSGGSSSLSGLSDVSISSPSNGQVLKYNGTSWTNTDLKTINGSSMIGTGDLTVTASAGGGNGQLQYNNSGALAGITGATTDGTNLFVPKLIGGSGTSSPLTLQSTSGVGAADYINFKVGNNGATEAMRILNNGSVIVGATAQSGTELMRVSGDFLAQGNIKIAKIDPTITLTNGTQYVNVLAGTSLSIFQYPSTTKFGVQAATSISDGGSSGKYAFIADGATANVLFGGVNYNAAAATAKIQIAGSSTGAAGTAPLKLTSGTKLATPEDGAVEYDGTHFYGTNSAGTRLQLDPTVQTLSSQYTDASNVSTTETNLLSYTLPANTLVNNGDRVVIEAMFTTPNNGNSKSMNFYFGSYSQNWGTSTIANGATIFVRATIYKTGSSSQRIQIERVTGYSDYPVFATSTIDETGTILIKFTGTGAASNDITQKTMAVTYYPVLAP